MRKHTTHLIILTLTILLIASVLLSASVGVVWIPFGEMAQLLINPSPDHSTNATIFFDIRLPRVILAVLVGAGLATAGAVMQGFFQNPMADPYIVGVSSGAALGATTAAILKLDIRLFGLSPVPLLAFIGAAGAVVLVYALSTRGGKIAVSTLLLTGVAVGSLLTAITSFIMVTTEEDLHAILFWLMGSFSSRGWDHVTMILPYLLIGLIVVRVFARDLNVMLLGDETAHHLGINVEQVKRVLLIVSALLAASSVAAGGIIGFVGLIVPHVMRLLIGPDHRTLIGASALAGGILLTLADTAARMVIAPSEIPVGIITALIGAPFFLFLLSRKKERA
jgi:iron complex transport system permease protein